MLGNGSVRGSMQQGWSPHGPMGSSGGPMMGQGVGPGRMIPGMSAAMPPRGPPGSRGMVGMQMMGNGEKSPRLMLTRSQTGNWFWHFLCFFAPSFLRDGHGKPCLPSAARSPQSDCTLARPDDGYGSLRKPKQVWKLKKQKCGLDAGLVWIHVSGVT